MREARRVLEAAGERDGFIHQPVGLVDGVDDAEFLALLRVEGAGGEDQLLRLLQPDDARQQEQPAHVRNEADAPEHLAEAGPRRGEDEIGGERDVDAGAVGRPVDRRDHRKLEADPFVEPAIDVLDALAALECRAPALGHPLNVAARAEGAAGAGDDHGMERGVVADIQDDLAELRAHRDVKRVAFLGPVQRDDREAIAHLVFERFVTHKAAP